MKNLVLLLVLCSSFTACHSQVKESEKDSSITITQETPKGNWEVHKKYDNNGNLIQKDSTYTYSWSSSKNGPLSKAETDSLMNHFQSQQFFNFDEMNLSDFKGLFDSSFFGDSLMGENFQKWDLGELHQRFMQQIDSTRARFYNERQQHSIPQGKKMEEESENEEVDYPVHNTVKQI